MSKKEKKVTEKKNYDKGIAAGVKNTKEREEKAKAKAKGTTTILKVLKQPEKPFRKDSARDNYWQRVQKFNGKTVKALEESVAKMAPSQPKKGKLAGKTEPLSGWVSWFKQQGLISISNK